MGVVAANAHFLIASAAYGSDVEGKGAPDQQTPGLLLGGIDHSVGFSVSIHSGPDASDPELDGFSFLKGAETTETPGPLGEGAPYPFTVTDPATEVLVRHRTGDSSSPYVDTNSNSTDITVVATKAAAVDTFTPVQMSSFAIE